MPTTVIAMTMSSCPYLPSRCNDHSLAVSLSFLLSLGFFCFLFWFCLLKPPSSTLEPISNIKMDQINFRSVAKALMELIQAKYNEEDEEIRECHNQIADMLLEKLEDAPNYYTFIEENVNIEGAIKIHEEYTDEESGMSMKRDSVPLKTKRKFVEDYTLYQGKWSFSTFQKRHRFLKHASYIPQWKRQVQQGGTNWEIYDAIDKHVWKIFIDARLAFLPIHDMDLKRWAMQKSCDFPGFTFKASDSWISSFKKRNGVSSRKIQKFVSNRSIRNLEEIKMNAENFRLEMNNIIKTFDSNNIWNTDQTGFNYECLSTRTLSHKGEKSTLGASFSPKNKATHSYTVQYIISHGGTIVGHLFICLQEKTNEFGPVVQTHLFEAPNLIIKCSKSGKLTKVLVESFLDEAVKPFARGEILYILDKWPCQTNMLLYESRFQTNEINMRVEFIPENCTDLVQPLDTYFHRQLKYIVRQFYQYELIAGGNNNGLALTSRNGILKLHSLVHFLLSAPAFKPMIQHCWVTSGIFVGEEPDFKNAKSICFSFNQVICELNDCVEYVFIRCSWCMKCTCFNHFFNEYHLKTCTDSPYKS